jgi:site-specific DNA-methyltransferase (adenine-specific)
VTVRTGAFVARRNGKVFVTGNSGFPKSLDVSKAIDKAAGAEREIVGRASGRAASPRNDMRGGQYGSAPSDLIDTSAVTAPATDAARQWSGWGTALKPASEPICEARKPLAGTVAATVLEYGTGSLNIHACRVGDDGGCRRSAADKLAHGPANEIPGSGLDLGNAAPRIDGLGRWPSNVVLSHAETCGASCASGCPVAEMDAQSGVLTSGANPTRRGSDKFRDSYGDFAGQESCAAARGADSGGASRFFPTFRYEAKAPTTERPRDGEVAHPTVKPLDLMRWLVRLVTQPGGVVLDPFAGSGTTGEACQIERMRCVLIEKEPAHVPLIVQRLTKRSDPVRHLADKGEDLGLFALLDEASA